MRRLGISLLVLAIGCNAILENEPGRLDARSGGEEPGSETTDTDPSEPAEPISSDGPDGGGSEEDDGTASNEAGARDASVSCTTGSKACGGLCVSTTDPFFGCADASCARCVIANATAACGPTGACAVGACVAGFADCNADPADGCETNLTTVNDCGACGLKCPKLKNVVMACVSGACTGTCAAGFGDCNAKPQDGCERNLLTDKRNCGACGTRCAIGRCEQGTCVWP